MPLPRAQTSGYHLASPLTPSSPITDTCTCLQLESGEPLDDQEGRASRQGLLTICIFSSLAHCSALCSLVSTPPCRAPANFSNYLQEPSLLAIFGSSFAFLVAFDHGTHPFLFGNLSSSSFWDASLFCPPAFLTSLSQLLSRFLFYSSLKWCGSSHSLANLTHCRGLNGQVYSGELQFLTSKLNLSPELQSPTIP